MTLRLVSPMQGWAGPLAELPDAAFAEGMVGDGVAIDPVGDALHAPCAGVVVGVHRARHAVTLRADNGAEILCHIGIETVALSGEGFTAHVADGDRVEAGALLVSFDLDRLARGAKSLVSPILAIDTEAFRISRRACDTRVAVGDWLMDLEATGAQVAASVSANAAVRDRAVTLPPGHGIHARPAAAIAACARRFAAEIEVVTSRTSASATSAVALMTLGLAAGDQATLRARGTDAEAALQALAELIEHGLKGEQAAPASIGITAPATRRGVTAVPGIAVGTIVRLESIRREPPAAGQGVAEETRSLEAAVATVRAALGQRMAAPAVQADIARAHLALLDDPRLHAAAAAAQTPDRPLRPHRTG
ncbi:glucose PTS transporter subunit IIA, partial [Sphingomonas bacterium]|uniref:glucose PTS transporter subunit IIA n=1 Tax=Sphingomonas bacterium TaxID=1895847 RepID=UPI001574F429